MSSNVDAAVSALEAVKPELQGVTDEDVESKVDSALAALQAVQANGSTVANAPADEAPATSAPLADSEDSSDDSATESEPAEDENDQIPAPATDASVAA